MQWAWLYVLGGAAIGVLGWLSWRSYRAGVLGELKRIRQLLERHFRGDKPR